MDFTDGDKALLAWLNAAGLRFQEACEKFKCLNTLKCDQAAPMTFSHSIYVRQPNEIKGLVVGVPMQWHISQSGTMTRDPLRYFEFVV